MAEERQAASLEIGYRHRSEVRRGWRRFRANRAALVGLGFIILIILMAVFADFISPYDPIEIASGKRGVGPSPDHPLGWDHVGRDLMSRVIFGARVALTVGLVASAVAIMIGVAVGAAAGYFGGGVDSGLMRLTDTLMAFPLIALLIMLSAVLGPSLVTTLIVIGTTTWSSYARVVRAVRNVEARSGKSRVRQPGDSLLQLRPGDDLLAVQQQHMPGHDNCNMNRISI